MAACVAAGLLTGCGSADTAKADKGAKTVPLELKKSDAPVAAAEVIAGVTPMADRVAVLGLLNKRNGLVEELTMKPGETKRVGNAIVRLSACEQTAPWENYPETGAFVQLLVLNSSDSKWYRHFSGWLFRERPERNVIEHPIYDVFVKSCAMTYPGGDTISPPVEKPAVSASSAPQSPATNGGEGSDEAAPAAPSPAAPSAPVTAPSVAPESTE